MPAIPLAAPDDPRLDAVLAASLKAMRIPASWEPTVRRLATGEMPQSSLRCCGSGCRPCVQDIQRCTVRVLTTLAAPPPEAPPSRTGLHLRARGRKLFGRLRGGDG